MSVAVAFGAKTNEILSRVITQLASRSDVMHFEIRRMTAVLAPPSIAFKHLPVELLVRFRGKAKARAPGPRSAHADFRSRAEKVCFNSSGSSSYSRHRARSMAWGDWLSSPAPARKSAQIISRQ